MQTRWHLSGFNVIVDCIVLYKKGALKVDSNSKLNLVRKTKVKKEPFIPYMVKRRFRKLDDRGLRAYTVDSVKTWLSSFKVSLSHPAFLPRGR